MAIPKKNSRATLKESSPQRTPITFQNVSFQTWKVDQMTICSNMSRHALNSCDMHDLHQVCHFMTRFPTQGNCEHEENWPTLLLEAIIKAKGFSRVGCGEKFGPSKNML